MDDFLPKISIIFAMLNGEKFLNRCLNSIRELSNVNEIEILIINNNSTDNSLDIIHTYEKKLNIKLINLGKNVGYAKASNLGVQNSKGEFIFITNVDVIYPTPDFFQKLLKIYKDYKQNQEIIISPAIVFEGDGIHYFGAKNHILGFSYTTDVHKILPNNKIIRMTQRASGGSLFMKKGPFIELGGYDNLFFIYYDDTDFSLRWLRNGNIIYTTNDPFIIHQQHKMTFSDFKYYLLERNRFLLFFKNIEGFKKLIPFFLILEMIISFHSILIKKFRFRIRVYYELISHRKDIKKLRKKSRKEINLLNFNQLSRKLDPILIGDLKNQKLYYNLLKIFNYFLKWV